jgi:photosystem II stability/assembly factor-like uncharacterized protein
MKPVSRFDTFLSVLVTVWSSVASAGSSAAANRNVPTSGTTSSLLAVSFVDADNGMAVGDYGIILRTTDGGDAWTSVLEEPFGYFTGLSLIDASNGWVVAAGSLLHTTVGG